MKALLYIFLSCFLYAGVVSAQSRKVNFGVSSSFDWNSYLLVDDESTLGDNKLQGRAGFSVGPFVRFRLSDRVTLDAGVSYSSKSLKRTVVSRPIDPEDPIVRGDVGTTIFHHGFLDIPVEVNITFAKAGTCSFYWSGGVVHSFLLHYNVDHDGYYDIGNYSYYKKFFVSAKTGVGFLVKFDKVALSIEPQVRYYITQVHESSPEDKPMHFGLEVAVLKL
jgi:hypothetical protein